MVQRDFRRTTETAFHAGNPEARAVALVRGSYVEQQSHVHLLECALTLPACPKEHGRQWIAAKPWECD